MAYRGIADFRSDTVTRPTAAMYEAMRTAALGDDGFGDDPTVRELEEVAARLMGKEAALLCPSGTMANQVAVRVHCRPGREVVVEERSHILNYEAGGLAFACLQARPVAGAGGVIDPEQLAAVLRAGDHHRPATGLLCLENTHNDAGGIVVPPANIAALSRLAHAAGVPVHLDGARIFNAHAAGGVVAAQIAAPADSVMFCLSKGLGCPIGSVLCGSRDFIARARGVRQYLGGGMRQAGIIAACGLVALRENIDRLADDHRRARALAGGLAAIEGLSVINEVQTNMVYFRLAGALSDLAGAAAAKGVLFIGGGRGPFRMVCHKDIDDVDVERAVAVIGAIVDRREGGPYPRQS